MSETALKGEKTFLPITWEGKRCYGGDQAWFEFTVGRYGGCGVVAAANLTAYLAGSFPELRGLYPHRDLSGKCFLQHMNELYRWVRPWKVPFVSRNRKPLKGFGWTLGVWPGGRFVRGVEAYAHSRNVKLEGRILHSARPLEELTGFIRESLGRDCPVAMLIGNRPDYAGEEVLRPDGSGWRQKSFRRHWVLITAIRKENRRFQVKVSTWGGCAWLDLNRWQQAGGFLPGLVTFYRF